VAEMSQFTTFFQVKKHLFFTEGILQLIISIGAIAAGLAMIIDPTGESLQMEEIVEIIPFESLLIPGIILFSVNGVATLFAAVLSFRYHRWAGYAGMILGVGLIIWIVTQVIMLDFGLSFLHPLYLLFGFVELVLGYWMYKFLEE
jgi:hypothetical protein